MPIALDRLFNGLVKRLGALFEATGGEDEWQVVECSDDRVHNLEATTASIRKKFFELVKHPLFIPGTAICAYLENFVEDICTAVLSSEFYSTAKNGWDWSTRLKEWRTRFSTLLDEYKVPERGRAGRGFESTCSARASSFSSKLDFAAVPFLHTFSVVLVVSPSGSPDTSMAGLEQASRQYFRI